MCDVTHHGRKRDQVVFSQPAVTHRLLRTGAAPGARGASAAPGVGLGVAGVHRPPVPVRDEGAAAPPEGEGEGHAPDPPPAPGGHGAQEPRNGLRSESTRSRSGADAGVIVPADVHAPIKAGCKELIA